MEKLIYGSGGGGSSDSGDSSRTAVEYPDTLRSKSYVKVIDLLGEGEFEEVMVGGMAGLFLDGTPVQNYQGDYNFTGLSVESRPGSLSQSRMSIGATTEKTESVGIEMLSWTPVEKTITGTSVDIVRVNIKIPSLTVTDTSTGDISGTTITFRIDWKEVSAPFWTVLPDETVSGKSSSEYEKQVSFRVTGNGPWTIRAIRTCPDSTSTFLNNKTYFSSITSVVEEKLRYPGSVLVGMQVDAEQFSSIPTRAYLCKCLRVKVPNNYDPITRIYSGIWNGGFKVAWTDNPAWCFYDIITNTRYGLGDRIPESAVDKSELYTIGQYCDQLVPGENGIYEPRFSCNVVIQTKEEAYKVISDFASIFRGLSYWAGGSIVPIQDRPTDPSYAFNNTSVVDGLFSYQSSAMSTRYNAVGVTWNNPANSYEREIEYVEDVDLINSLGYINQTDIVAFGCTSRAMARRVGRWLIYTNNYQTDIVTFTTGMEGSVPLPGEIVKISDTLRSQDRRGGRVVASTLLTATLDTALEFTAGVSYTFSAIDIDGTLVDRLFTATGSTDNITFDSALTKELATNSIFIIADNDVEPELFKIVSISDKGNKTYEISALSHNPSKYAYVESSIPLVDTSIPSQLVYPVAGIDFIEYLYVDGVSVKSRCDISWRIPKFANRYIVNYKKPDGSSFKETIIASEYSLKDTAPGTYSFSVTAINVLGQQATTFSQQITLAGKTKQPLDITGFEVVASNGSALLRWDTHPDLDVLVGGFIQILHTSKTVSPKWIEGVQIDIVSGSSSSAIVPLLGGTYMLKAIDSSDYYSKNAAFAFSDYALLQNKNIVEVKQESPDFLGTKVNTMSSGGVLSLASLGMIDDAGYVDTYVLFDYLGSGVSTSGEYYFNEIVDLTAVYTVGVSCLLSSTTTEIFSLVDIRPNIDEWSEVDNLVPNTGTAKVYISTTKDDPTGTPTWSDWTEFRVADYAAWGMKFKLMLASESAAFNTLVDELSVTVDVEDRAFGVNDATCTTSGLVVAFSPHFMETPAISVAINNMQSGDYYEITSKSAEGFTIIVKNAGTPVTRVIDYIAKGYGYKI